MSADAMRGAAPRATHGRARRTLLLLVVATCVTWWLGADHPMARDLSASAAVVVAAAKVGLIAQDFMGLGTAPRRLSAVFYGWLSCVTVLCLVLILG
jgi:hypothetical protein